MFEALISTLMESCGQLIDAVCTVMLDMMSCSLSAFLEYFPLLDISYSVFQTIAVGLVLIIAIVETNKFAFANEEKLSDTPLSIVGGSMFAGVGIFMGGYLCELIANLANIPFNYFRDLDVIDYSNQISNFGKNCLQFGAGEVGAVTLGGTAVLLGSFLIIALIGFNVIKLLLEVCERYLLVGVLTILAPLFFATLASRATREIFKKWVSTLIGQCISMSVSAWMIKLIMSGFDVNVTTGTELAWRLLLILALCKVAQRTDDYMRDLGISSFRTGSNEMSDLLMLGALLGGGRKFGGGASKTAVLGSTEGRSASRFGGIVGGLSNMAQKGMEAYKSGATGTEIGRAMKGNFAQGVMHNSAMANGVANAVSSAVKASNKGEGGLKNLAQEGKKNFTSAFSSQAKANYMAKHGASSGSVVKNSSGASGTSGTSGAEARKEHLNSAKETYVNRGTGNLTVGENEKTGNQYIKSDSAFSKAGLSVVERGADSYSIEGDTPMVADYIGNHFTEKGDMASDAVQTTINTADSALAEETLLCTDYSLSGNDDGANVLLDKAFGSENITDGTESKFTNISAETVNGSRVISCTDEAGNSYRVTDSYDQYLNICNENNISMSHSRQIANGIIDSFSDENTPQKVHSFKTKDTGKTMYSIRVKDGKKDS